MVHRNRRFIQSPISTPIALESQFGSVIERSQNPRLGVIDQASAIHDGMDPDEIAPVRFQGDRLLPVPRNGLIGCDQEPPMKVAPRTKLGGEPRQSSGGPFRAYRVDGATQSASFGGSLLSQDHAPVCLDSRHKRALAQAMASTGSCVRNRDQLSMRAPCAT